MKDKEFRCRHCDKLLFKADEDMATQSIDKRQTVCGHSTVKIKCDRCKNINVITIPKLAVCSI